MPDEQAVEALQAAARELLSCDLSCSPAYLSNRCLRAASRYFRTKDPFEKAKREHNRLALRLLGQVEPWVRSSPDPVKAALLLMASGNIIDLGTQESFDLEGTFRRNQEAGFKVDHYHLLRGKLRSAASVLVLADNAGEVVFDAFFLQLLPGNLEKWLAVKSGPILNDVTRRDLEGIDLSGINVVETGSDGLGVMFEELSEPFRRLFEEADVVVSKGHANFETLDDAQREVFLLLQVKCEVVARRLGASVGDTILVLNRLLPPE